MALHLVGSLRQPQDVRQKQADLLLDHVRVVAHPDVLDHRLHGLDVPTEFFAAAKDTPTPLLHGATPREAYIAYSDRLHALYGPTVLSDIMIQRLKQLTASTHLVLMDGGLAVEVLPVLENIGLKQSAVVRLHRPGKDFRGDIRGYIDHPGGNNVDLRNAGSIEDLDRLVVRGFEVYPHLKARINNLSLVGFKTRGLQVQQRECFPSSLRA